MAMSLNDNSFVVRWTLFFVFHFLFFVCACVCLYFRSLHKHFMTTKEVRTVMPLQTVTIVDAINILSRLLKEGASPQSHVMLDISPPTKHPSTREGSPTEGGKSQQRTQVRSPTTVKGAKGRGPASSPPRSSSAIRGLESRWATAVPPRGVEANSVAALHQGDSGDIAFRSPRSASSRKGKADDPQRVDDKSWSITVKVPRDVHGIIQPSEKLMKLGQCRRAQSPSPSRSSLVSRAKALSRLYDAQPNSAVAESFSTPQQQAAPPREVKVFRYDPTEMTLRDRPRVSPPRASHQQQQHSIANFSHDELIARSPLSPYKRALQHPLLQRGGPHSGPREERRVEEELLDSPSLIHSNRRGVAWEVSRWTQ